MTVVDGQTTLAEIAAQIGRPDVGRRLQRCWDRRRRLHGRVLFDSSHDTVVNANNDILYSTTFAGLRREPIVVSVPPTGDRYFVIQLVDMGTDISAYIGTRVTGRDGGDFLLVGPRFKGPMTTTTGGQRSPPT